MARAIEVKKEIGGVKPYFAVRVNLEESSYAETQYGYKARIVSQALCDDILVIGRFPKKTIAESLAREINAQLHGAKQN